MSQTLLDVNRRPTVIFNPKNAEHRRYVAEFYRNGTWGKCPVLFYAFNDVSVKSMTSQSLIEHYLNQEFPADTKPKSKGKPASTAGKLFKIAR